MVDDHSSNVRAQFVKSSSPNRNELNSDKLHDAVEHLSVTRCADSDSLPRVTVVMSDTPFFEVDRDAQVSPQNIVMASVCAESKNTILCNSHSTDQLEYDEYDNQNRNNDVHKKQSIAITYDMNEDSEDIFAESQISGIKNNISEEQCSSGGSICMRESPRPSAGLQGEKDSPMTISPPHSNCSKNDLAILAIPKESIGTSAAIRKLRVENEQLQAEVTRLRRLVVSGAFSLLNERKAPVADIVSSPSSSIVNEEEAPVSPAKIQSLQIELQLTKEALSTLKSDRRRLKAEKFELLQQMKQLYETIEDKEKQLRDFIRNYEQRMRDNTSSLQQLSTEREERERERWSLLRHARDEAERSLLLAAQLNAKDLQLQHTQEQLQDVRRQLASSGCFSDQESVVSIPRHSLNGGAITPSSGGFPTTAHGLALLTSDRGSCSADSGVRVNSDRESGATSIGGNLSDSTIDGTPAIRVANDIDVDTISIVSSIPPPHMYQSAATNESSPTISPATAPQFSKCSGSTVLSRSVEQLSSPLDPEPVMLSRRYKNSHNRAAGGRGGTWGSISRVFARSRNRNKSQSLHDNSESNLEAFRNWSPLTEEGYAEKLKLLREASSIPMERWRAPTVVAWLEVALGMPQYGTRCAENIKSGKVLMELSDFELECGLGITHPMHRKKLRLAIEEHRHPEMIRYSYIAQLGHTWVSSEWLPDLGLSQYADGFAANLVDARVLEHLSKKELEKYLGVTRKFYQASIVHGIHLLRIMKYDRQALAVRRHQCENIETDPLVWTNQRFIRWARNIDLGEYADNLKDSGVHGGLVVLEPSFNGDTMASALGIPASKNIIRRHLNAELDTLVLPARYIMFCQMDDFQVETARTGSKHFKMGKSKVNNC